MTALHRPPLLQGGRVDNIARAAKFPAHIAPRARASRTITVTRQQPSMQAGIAPVVNSSANVRFEDFGMETRMLPLGSIDQLALPPDSDALACGISLPSS